MKVLLLAGGIGKRFWPITTSKVLMPFFGKPLIFSVINDFRSIGLNDIIVVTNKDDDGEIKNLGVTTVVQKNPNGMADAVLSARSLIGNSPCLIKNALDIFDQDFYKRMQKKLEVQKTFVVAKKNETYFDGGYYKVEGNRVVGIVEKPGAGNEPSNLTDVVFHYFQNPNEFFELLAKSTSDRDDVYEKALDKYLSTHQTECLVHEGTWLPVKYPWHLLDVMDILLQDIKDYRGKNVDIKQNVVIEGPVYIEDGVKIFENTKIVGPCYIGKNTIIGNNNIIRESHIGSDCVSGFNTDITRSYVGRGCWFHSNYIGDSVLEGDTSFGSGTVLANLRLDEGKISATARTKLGAVIAKGVRVGVNTSIMPGVKSGKNSFIGAGIVVSQDVPDDSFCVGNTTLEIRKNTKKLSSSRDAFRKDL